MKKRWRYCNYCGLSLPKNGYRVCQRCSFVEAYCGDECLALHREGDYHAHNGEKRRRA